MHSSLIPFKILILLDNFIYSYQFCCSLYDLQMLCFKDCANHTSTDDELS